MLRRNFIGSMVTGAMAQAVRGQQQVPPPPDGRMIYLERSANGQPHRGKVLLAIEAHSDDIPLSSSGTVAKLIDEGYMGYLVRATNDDMGDSPGLGTVGTIGENVLGNERDNNEIAQILG